MSDEQLATITDHIDGQMELRYREIAEWSWMNSVPTWTRDGEMSWRPSSPSRTKLLHLGSNGASSWMFTTASYRLPPTKARMESLSRRMHSSRTFKRSISSKPSVPPS